MSDCPPSSPGRYCGCRVNGDTHQRWRGPLRQALDWLRDHVDLFYEARASAHFKDPWAARDDYIDVVLDRAPERLAAFLDRHQRGKLDPAAGLEARRLLELQLLQQEAGEIFTAAVPASERARVSKGIAVAGTATSCAAILQELDPYDPAKVHGFRLLRASSGMTGSACMTFLISLLVSFMRSMGPPTASGVPGRGGGIPR